MKFLHKGQVFCLLWNITYSQKKSSLVKNNSSFWEVTIQIVNFFPHTN